MIRLRFMSVRSAAILQLGFLVFVYVDADSGQSNKTPHAGKSANAFIVCNYSNAILKQGQAEIR